MRKFFQALVEHNKRIFQPHQNIEGEMNKNFLKEQRHMPKKIHKMPLSLQIMEMKIKTALIYKLTPQKLASQKMITNMDERKKKLPFTVWNVFWSRLFGKLHGNSSKNE